MLIILFGFLFPIFISGIFYTKLIFYKKKLFLNKIDALNNKNDIPHVKKDLYKEALSEARNPGSSSHHQSENENVELPHPEIHAPTNDQNQIEVAPEVNIIPSIFSVEDEKILQEKEAERNKAQIVAAEHSMQTNLVVGGWFCVFLVIQIVIVPKSLREHVGLIVCSIMRSILPIFTTMANFGTVRFVTSLYWSAFQKVFPFLTKQS